jgi:histidinol phosphatase-like enzyme/predicted kinase
MLTEEDRARLDERFARGGMLREWSNRAAQVNTKPSEGEVVLIMGLPRAGKSTLARTFVEQGFSRLNRDEAGGSLRQLVPALERLVDAGHQRIVLDNTYASRKSRAAVIQAAHARSLPVRCVNLSTSLEDAQVNTVWRMVAKYGRLLGPEDMKDVSKRDVSAFGPSVLFRYHRELEPPDTAEGFSQIDTVDFARAIDPSFSNRALIVWCDGVLVRSRSDHRTPISADDVEVIAGRGERLREFAREGWRIFGLSWQPEVATNETSVAQVERVFAKTRELLEVPIEILHCPHAAGPPVCWCRKPLPGLGVVLIQQHRLDPSQCIYVGNGSQDPGFARRLGFQYQDASEFFAAGTTSG